MKKTEHTHHVRHFEALCRQHGLSVTVQRRAIFEALLAREDHPTADDLYADVKHKLPGISRTTVYRVLDALVEIGVVLKVSSQRAAERYDARTHRHHHLVCLQCDKLIDFEDERLDKLVKLPDVRGHSFDIRDFSIHFHGVCAACRRKAKSRKNGPHSKTRRAKSRSHRKKS